MFSVGGIQSSVAEPVVGLLDLVGGGVGSGAGVAEFVEVLLVDATVVVVELEVVVVAGVVVDATVVELDLGAVPDTTVVEADAGVVPDTGAAPGVVLAARFASVATTAPGAAVAEVRSITPVLGDTRLGVGSAAADVVPELLDPSAPQAARPNVTRLHNTTLRMCERTARADFFIDHYPG